MQSDCHQQNRRRTAADRSRLVSLYRSSGLTQADFAEQHGINVHTLRQWIYRPGGKGAPKPSGALIALREISMSSLLPGAWAAEVSLPSGMTVRLNSAASPELITQLLARLSSRC